MAFDWLLGKRRDFSWEGGINITLPSLSLDIDVVVDTVRAMNASIDADLGNMRPPALPDGYTPTEDEARDRAALAEKMQRLEALRPVVSVLPVHHENGFAEGRSYPVDVEVVESLGASERARLAIYGASVGVELRKGVAPAVSSGGEFRNDDLVRQIARVLEDEGRRRPRWRALVRFLPAVFATALSAAWVVAFVDESVPLAMRVLTGMLVVAVWVGVALWYPRLSREFAEAHPGVHFRQVSRSELRERLRNVWAGSIVALVTFVLTVIGTLLVTWLTGVLQLEPNEPAVDAPPAGRVIVEGHRD